MQYKYSCKYIWMVYVNQFIMLAKIKLKTYTQYIYYNMSKCKHLVQVKEAVYGSTVLITAMAR